MPRRGTERARRGRAKKNNQGLILALVGAVVVMGVLAVVLVPGNGDEASGGNEGTDTASKEESTPGVANVSGEPSVFDASAVSADDGGGKKRVVGRDPKTLSMEKLTKHLGSLYLSRQTAEAIKALEEEVKRHWNERYDVTPEMIEEFRRLEADVSSQRHDPFLSLADAELNKYNTVYAKSDIHLRDADDKLFPRPFNGFVRKPYAFFVQASKEGRDEEIVEQVHDQLVQLKDAFVDYFDDFVELKTTKEGKVIKVMLFRTLKDYQTYTRIKEPERDPTFSLAHYEPAAQMLCVPLRLGPAGGSDPEHTRREVMFHEGTHQLLHYYTDQPHLSAYGAMWSDEGVAEYFGGHRAEKDGKYLFGKINSRIQSVARDQNDPKRRITFIQLLKWTRSDYFRERQENEREATEIHLHVYSQGWALVAFLNHYENGIYRKDFQSIMKQQIETGDYGLPVFRRVFGDRFETVEKQFNAYLDRLTDLWTAKKMRVGDDAPTE